MLFLFLEGCFTLTSSPANIKAEGKSADSVVSGVQLLREGNRNREKQIDLFERQKEQIRAGIVA